MLPLLRLPFLTGLAIAVVSRAGFAVAMLTLCGCIFLDLIFSGAPPLARHKIRTAPYDQ